MRVAGKGRARHDPHSGNVFVFVSNKPKPIGRLGCVAAHLGGSAAQQRKNRTVDRASYATTTIAIVSIAIISVCLPVRKKPPRSEGGPQRTAVDNELGIATLSIDIAPPAPIEWVNGLRWVGLGVVIILEFFRSRSQALGNF